MLGTIVNTGAIIAGCSTGALLKKGVIDPYRETVTQALGLTALALGISMIVRNMAENSAPLLFIISLVAGAVIGSALDLDGKTDRLGKRFSRSDSHSNLMEGLTTAVLLFCVGTLSILGPMESALKGDNTLLFTNALLDGITSLVLASTFGIGIILSAPVLFLWQGSIYLTARLAGPFVSPELLVQISIIGGILIMSAGINILGIIRIRTVNLLPALFIPVIYHLIAGIG